MPLSKPASDVLDGFLVCFLLLIKANYPNICLNTVSVGIKIVKTVSLFESYRFYLIHRGYSSSPASYLKYGLVPID